MADKIQRSSQQAREIFLAELKRTNPSAKVRKVIEEIEAEAEGEQRRRRPRPAQRAMPAATAPSRRAAG